MNTVNGGLATNAEVVSKDTPKEEIVATLEVAMVGERFASEIVNEKGMVVEVAENKYSKIFQIFLINREGAWKIGETTLSSKAADALLSSSQKIPMPHSLAALSGGIGNHENKMRKDGKCRTRRKP